MKNTLKVILTAITIAALFTTSASADQATYDSTLKAIAQYQKSVDRGDLQRTLEAQNEALESWKKLSRTERLRIEREVPGALGWLQGGDDYTSNSGLRARAAARR